MFNIGERVHRIEVREVVGAVVIAVDGDNYELQYDEGGTGWWPMSALIKEPDNA